VIELGSPAAGRTPVIDDPLRHGGGGGGGAGARPDAGGGRLVPLLGGDAGPLAAVAQHLHPVPSPHGGAAAAGAPGARGAGVRHEVQAAAPGAALHGCRRPLLRRHHPCLPARPRSLPAHLLPRRQGLSLSLAIASYIYTHS